MNAGKYIHCLFQRCAIPMLSLQDVILTKQLVIASAEIFLKNHQPKLDVVLNKIFHKLKVFLLLMIQYFGMSFFK